RLAVSLRLLESPHKMNPCARRIEKSARPRGTTTLVRCGRWQRSASDVPGETEFHKTLKKEACRWLYRMGYRCIAAEVRLPPLGIVDAVGTGVFRAHDNYLFVN